MPKDAPRQAQANDLDPLIELWERSVRATHTFLSEHDIVALRPEVRKVLAVPGVWVMEDAKAPTGFMLLDGNRVEALFIDPEHQGQGLGTRLLDHARQQNPDAAELLVDVNEQNPDALAFYHARGFEVIRRSPVDDAGRPFPLLHLRKKLNP